MMSDEEYERARGAIVAQGLAALGDTVNAAPNDDPELQSTEPGPHGNTGTSTPDNLSDPTPDSPPVTPRDQNGPTDTPRENPQGETNRLPQAGQDKPNREI